jgi:hypothetical protein
MKPTLLVTNLLLLFLTFNGFSQQQKVTVKKDIVNVNDVPVFTLVSTSYPDALTLYNLNNEKLAYFFTQFYSDAGQIKNANPQGRVGYFEITFFNEGMDKCEIRIVGFKKQLAELIISEGLVKDGKLDETAVKQFCRINGMKFSEDRKNAGTTIIIKN